ncbi:MAG: drug/metabolite transporter (DMT)-like permease [Polaribacter sp.]|jgi:drug/metabolite transporter (DMT)-like permease
MESKQNESVSLYSWFLLILLSLTWGSSYILMKKGLLAYEPEQMASVRISISMLCFLPFFFLRFRKIDWSKWKYFLIIGLTGNFLPSFLFAFAETEISSSLAGVLSSLTPLFTLLLGLLIYGIPFTRNKAAAVGIGLAGAVVLVLYGSGANFDGNKWYALLVVMAAMMYAISSNTVKKHLGEIKPFDMSVASFTMVGVPAMVYLFNTDFLHRLQTHEAGWSSLGYISILSVVGTVIASVLFYKLVQLTTPVIASMVSYLIPVVALFWGFMDGEPISIFHFLGMGLILVGVYVSKQKKGREI